MLTECVVNDNSTISLFLNSWPLILDPDTKSLRWIHNLHKNRMIRQIRQGDEEEEISSTLQKCIKGGDVAIFYDVSAYDSCLNSVLTKNVVKKSKVILMERSILNDVLKLS